jgi:hypothetical protein
VRHVEELERLTAIISKRCFQAAALSAGGT